MKQKYRFVKAGTTSIDVVYPPGFRELCKHLDIAPETAINRLITELSICGVHCSVKTDPQATAGLLFETMIGRRGSMPDEPSQLKKEIAALFFLLLIEVEKKIADRSKLASGRKQIIRQWYVEYQKRCKCTGN